MKPETIWTNKVYFGKRKDDNVRIYLSAPSWDCDWYWGFGYLGNKNEHYHLDGYQNNRNINMHNALITDYDLNPKIEKNLWIFCDLVLTVYKFKEIAEIYKRGNNYSTTTGLESVVKNPTEYKKINEELLPLLFDKIYELIKD